MMFNVPQFIDVEDKIAGPLTWRQFGWMLGLGAILLIVWNLLEFSYFIMTAIPVTLIFVALAFYKPYGQPLIKMVFYGLIFITRSKTYTWQRTAKPPRNTPKPKPQEKKQEDVQVFSLDEIQSIAKGLDNPDEFLRQK